MHIKVRETLVCAYCCFAWPPYSTSGISLINQSAQELKVLSSLNSVTTFKDGLSYPVLEMLWVGGESATLKQPRVQGEFLKMTHPSGIIFSRP